MKLPYRWISAAALCLTSIALAPRAFAAELALPRDGWTSWKVAAVEGAPEWCCWSDSRNFRDAARASCRLDSHQGSYGNRDNAKTDAIRVYARTAGGKIDRLRALAATCSVETATSIQDLGTVAADDSARWLVDLSKQSKDALPALALNRGDRARDALAGIARSDTRDENRKQAVFWLALLRGNEGADITSSVMFNDKSADIREHAAFALSQSDAPRATADLIRLGKTDKAAEVRAQAWFWLAQTGAAEAESAIFAALRNEADDEVRERAIIGLSQLPEDRGTRALIIAAEDRSLSRDLRKRAVFWLSQSDSDSAATYLEQVLTANY